MLLVLYTGITILSIIVITFIGRYYKNNDFTVIFDTYDYVKK